MIKQILTSVRAQIAGELVTELGLSRREAKKSISIAGDCASNIIQEEAQKGNTEALMSLFSEDIDSSLNNPIINRIRTLFLTKMSASLNIKGHKSAKVSDMVIPVLIKEIAQSFKTSNLSDFTAQLSLFRGSARLRESLSSRLGNFFRRR